MRIIRTIDPLSGKTVQKEITLSSTTGVSVSQHEELQKSSISDVTIASNQLTRAVYDVRDTMRETNVINYEISKKLRQGIDDMASSTSDAISMGYQTNADAINDMREEIEDFKQADLISKIDSTDKLTDAISSASHDTTVSVENASQNVSSSITASASVIKTALDTMSDSTNAVLAELQAHDISSADELTVLVDGEKMTVNKTFTDIFRLLSTIITEMSGLVDQLNAQRNSSSDGG